MKITNKSKKTSPMDIYEKLKADHRKVSALFKKLLSTKEQDSEKRTSLFNEIYCELGAHAQAEEDIFYPRAGEQKATHTMVLEAREEHNIVKLLLEELRNLENTSEIWTAKAQVLSEIVDHHVKEEETELFPKCKKFISKDESKEIARLVSEEEESVKEDLRAKAA